MMTNEKLKPCPLCGGEAEQDDWRNNEHMFYGTGWIGCRKCRCFINYTGKDRGKEEAIAAWNRRANDEQTDS